MTVDRAAARATASRCAMRLDAIEALGGRNVGEVYEGERRFRLQVRVPSGLRDDIDQVRNLPVSGQSGPLVPLGQIASIQIVDSPGEREPRGGSSPYERGGQRARPRPASFVGEAQTRVRDQVQMPPGYVVQWGAVREPERCVGAPRGGSSRRARAHLHPALHGVRAAQAGAAHLPQRALRRRGRRVPLALRGMPFSISAAIGFIALFGIAVLNGVVLLTTIKKLRARQVAARAAQEGAESRLRLS